MPKEKASEKHDLGIRNPLIDLEPFLADKEKAAKARIRFHLGDVYEKVCEVLYSNRDVDASRIIVAINDGEVTLSGQVPSRDMKWAAESCIAETTGVLKIYNELQVSENNSGLKVINH
jgi:hypothetical protein